MKIVYAKIDGKDEEVGREETFGAGIQLLADKYPVQFAANEWRIVNEDALIALAQRQAERN